MKTQDWLLRVLAKGPEYLAQRVRDSLWQRILDCPGFSAGAGASIVGDRHMRLGNGFRAGRMLWLETVSSYGPYRYSPTLVIGNRFSGSDALHIACAFSVEIGDDVLVGSKVHITDHNHGVYQGDSPHSAPSFAPASHPLHGRGVRIGHRVFLADGVVVLPGSTIGDGVVVGANSVVSGELPSDTICVGTPAFPIKRYNLTSQTWQRIA
jgi:lipopolysaccharide O-acetyltransferase